MTDPIHDAAQALLDANKRQQAAFEQLGSDATAPATDEYIHACGDVLTAEGELRAALAARAQPTTDDGAANVNDYVWVQLTEYGWSIYDHHIAHPIAGVTSPDPETARSWVTVSDDWQRFQLWELMSIFGPHLHNGMRQMSFDRNVVRFADPGRVRVVRATDQPSEDQP